MDGAREPDRARTKNPDFNANGQQTDDGVNYTSEWDASVRIRRSCPSISTSCVPLLLQPQPPHRTHDHRTLRFPSTPRPTRRGHWTVQHAGGTV